MPYFGTEQLKKTSEQLEAAYGILRPLSLTNGRQLRAARVLIGWEQIELALAARVAISTIRRMESFEGAIHCNSSTLTKVQQTLEKAGIEFLNHGEPGVRLKKQPTSRKRKGEA